MKKTLAIMLALIMVLALVPSVALAVEALNTEYGTFSYEKGKWCKDVTLEIYLDGKEVLNKTQEIKNAAASASFKASEGYFIEKVEINKGTWGTASSVHSPTPKSKEYSGTLTLLPGNSKIKIYLVKSCKLTVEYQYTDKSAGNSDIKKYQDYTKEVYPGEEFKSNEWKYYDAEDVREYYTSSVKDGNGNDVNVKGTPIIGRYFNGTITEDATYTVTFAPANTKDFLEINSYEGRGVTGNYMNTDFRYYGYEISGENGADKVYIVKDGKLTADASKNTRNDDPGIIIKDGKTYKYVFAGLGGDLAQIKDVYYDSSEQNWYYIYRWVTSFDAIDVSWTNTVGPIRIPATEEGRINFVYKETTNSHILNYDANGGKNAPEKQEEKTSAPSATFTIPQTTPTYDGYDFLGWADDANATEAQYKPGERITVSGEMTIYAVWKSKEVQTRDITLTYNGNANDEANGVPPAVTKHIPTTEPSATFDISTDEPTREGYEFLGWSQNPNATEPDTFTDNQIVATGDVTLYAVWKENKPEPETFPGVITVKKTVESNDLADKNKEFNFKVTVITGPNPDPSGPPIAKSANAVKAPAVRAVDNTAPKDKYDFVNENGIPTLRFTLKHGDSMKIEELPVGFTYRVEELDAAGYTVTVNNEPTSSKDVGLTKEKPEMTLEFKNTKGSTPTPTPTPYNGGGGYYYPTTTPVPVIVIPPKTGDMTVWQSILHFLGIR